MDNKKTLSLVTAGVLSLAMCGTLVSRDIVDTTEVEAVTEMSAIDIVNDMGSGWNLGNTFDSTNTWTNPLTVNAIETAWGNATTTQDMISTIHDYGFDSVRIPITWWQMMDDDNTISEDYLARIKEVVDWCYEENMYVIINTHHDDLSSAGDNWLSCASTDITTAQKNYETVWTQIADYFADYDNHLVFEGMNEPDFGTANVVALNQTFVDTVRATGGNNADRLLLVSAPETNLTKALSSDFTLPDDDMIAVSIHYYLPSTFCVAEAGASWGYASTWGTTAEKNELVNNFESMKSKFVDNGIPVILGEYGVLTEEENGKDHDSVVDFLQTVAETSKSYDGISAYLWDSGNGGDMKYFDRKNLTFFDSEIGQMFIDVNGSDYEPIELTWVETEITTDSKGVVAVNTNGASKIKLEATCDVPGSGTGAVGYWDNNANDGKGAWVQDTVYIRFDTDEDGNVTISQTWDNPDIQNYDSKGNPTDEANNYEEVLHDGYFELPESADTSSVQIMYFYGGYMDGDNWTTMTSSQYPTLTKAYIPGLSTSDTETTTTTTEPEVTEPVDETTATEVEVTTTVDDAVLPEEPDFENLYGYVYPMFDNGVVSQWDNDGTLADAVAVTGNGDYTLTINIPADGAAQTIEFFALATDLNKYQQNSSEEEIFSDLTFTINSILVDGEEIEYIPSDNALSTNDDGSTYRFSIYDSWSNRNVQDIDNLVINTTSIVVNFTIDGILNGGEIESPAETVATTTAVSDGNSTLEGTVLEINAEENTANIELSDGSNVTVSLDLLGTSIFENSVVNVKFSNGQLVSVTPVDDTTETPEETSAVTEVPEETTVASDGEVTTEAPTTGDDSVVKGDVNNDGEVNSVDLLTVKKYLLTMIDETALNTTNADVNGDGEVNSVDLLKIKKFLLTIIDSLD